MIQTNYKPALKFVVGNSPAVSVEVHPTCEDIVATVSGLGLGDFRAAGGACVHRMGEKDPVATIYLAANHMDLVTIVHEVVHALQATRFYRIVEDNYEDCEWEAHWVSEAVEEIVAELMNNGFVWGSKDHEGALFFVGMQLSLKQSAEADPVMP